MRKAMAKLLLGTLVLCAPLHAQERLSLVAEGNSYGDVADAKIIFDIRTHRPADGCTFIYEGHVVPRGNCYQVPTLSSLIKTREDLQNQQTTDREVVSALVKALNDRILELEARVSALERKQHP